jgi:5-oxoprolinase (ATP-hydrolysing)
MSIAEQMGRTLQRTSISVNIKERLDFSCALFSGCMLREGGGGVDLPASGTLVSNAPHIPVHLGAMSAAVRHQLQHYMAPGAGGLRAGDVLVSNHPQLAGGSHLPDMTVITPVFLRDAAGGIGDAAGEAGGEANPIVFFVASRGHHSDIGGIAPGSMPPTSCSLAEEGAAIVTCKLVRQGAFAQDDIVRLLLAPGLLGIPGCVGTRNVPDVLSDLRAQIAANERGVRLIRELCDAEGLHVVHSYMRHIQANAEQSVRSMLKRHAAGLLAADGTEGSQSVTLSARDFMDDGSIIALSLTLDASTGDAHFDFSGTSSEVLGNTNAPPAVTSSAVIYALRCMVGRDIPLNEGCLAPVTLTVPAGCLLNPSPEAAVVGGNVLTSQRVTDVVFKAFGAAAASQGCMNNLTFGDDSMGFYETICGGSGAGPSWRGRSGVHTHMTNTRITDPEVIEKRYPIVLRAFFLRKGSGGVGANPGGDGVVRALEFRKPLQVSILSERRAFAPWGLAGGGDAARGINLLFKAAAVDSSNATGETQASVVMGVQVSEPGSAGGRVVNVGGKRTFAVTAGDVFVVATPGGGGYGAVGSSEAVATDAGSSTVATKPLGGGSWGALKAEQSSF